MRVTLGMTRDYYRLLAAYAISTVGTWLYQLALPLLVYEITHSALSMALTYALAFLPTVLFTPVGGVTADRVDRRRLLGLGDLTSAVVVGALTFAVWRGVHNMWIIYPAAFVVATITPFYHPAFQSFIPQLVPRQQLTKGNAWLSGTENVVALIGPLVGGIAIATLGTMLALFLDATSFLASALFILAIGTRPSSELKDGATRSSWLGDLRDGLAFIWAQPVLRYGSLLFLGVNFALTMIEANYIYFLADVLRFTPAQIGLAFAIAALGAIIGALVAPAVEKQLTLEAIILYGTIVSGLLILPLLVARDVLSVALPWAGVTALGTITAVSWFTLRQQMAPEHLLGRVVAFTRFIAFAAVPVAAVLSGVLLNVTRNMDLIIIASAVISIVVGGFGFLTPLHRRPASESLTVLPPLLDRDGGWVANSPLLDD